MSVSASQMLKQVTKNISQTISQAKARSSATGGTGLCYWCLRNNIDFCSVRMIYFYYPFHPPDPHIAFSFFIVVVFGLEMT